jgi:hypothetical protein
MSVRRSWRIEAPGGVGATRSARGPKPSLYRARQSSPKRGRSAAARQQRHDGSVALLLLTNKESLEEAYGAARDFWKKCRDRWGELTYFCWMELTAAGLPHYHAIWVNPPPGFWSRETRDDLERYWGNRYVKWKRRDLAWFGEKAGAYVGGYAKKFGEKDYQQNYDDVPSTLRTFMCQRLDHDASELAKHETHWEGAYRDHDFLEGVWRPVPPYLELIGVTYHEHDVRGIPYVTKSESLARRARGHRRGAPIHYIRQGDGPDFSPPGDSTQPGRDNLGYARGRIPLHLEYRGEWGDAEALWAEPPPKDSQLDITLPESAPRQVESEQLTFWEIAPETHKEAAGVHRIKGQLQRPRKVADCPPPTSLKE